MSDFKYPPQFFLRLGAAFFTFVFIFSLTMCTVEPAFGQEKTGRSAKKNTAAEKKASASKSKPEKAKSENAAEEKSEEDLFLREGKENQEFLPDIYRCPDCGYEQDEPGFCPDHNSEALILVRSQGKNPLEPPELDGNEDIVVDIPLTGLSIKKSPQVSGTAILASMPVNLSK